MGLGARRRALAARHRRTIVRPPHPRGSGTPTRGPAGRRLHEVKSGGDGGAAANNSPRCWSSAGSRCSWCWCTSSSCSAAVRSSATPRRRIGLSVLATAVVALSFEPVQSPLEVVSRGWCTAERPSPYDGPEPVLASRDRRLPRPRSCRPGWPRSWPRAPGRRAQVWLIVDGRLTLAATWPTEAERPDRTGAAGTPRPAVCRCATAGELLGVLVVQEHEDVPLTPVEERLFAGLAAQAGLVLRGERLRAELVHRLAELVRPAAELRSLEATADRHPGRRAAAARARHPRRRSAAPGRAGGQPEAGPDRGRTVARTGCRLVVEQTRRLPRAIETLTSSRGHLPAPARRRRAVRPPLRGRDQPDAGDRRGRPAESAAGRRRGGAVLLRDGGGAERGQALVGDRA